MVEEMIGKMIQHDSFWAQNHDCYGQFGISPYVKFLTAQKMICYGVSFSAFQDTFQMGESTARMCFMKLIRGIYECAAISQHYH